MTDVQDPNRLAALAALDILDTPPERGFDRIVQLARRLCHAPVALVSLVAGERQWFKARAGFEPCETGLDASVCRHALGGPDLLVIPDLASDLRTAANPLVTGGPRLRFYAGAPLLASGGQVLGTLCVLDHVPRPGGLTPAEAEDLEALAEQVMAQLDLRRALAERDRVARQREAVAATLAGVTASGGDLAAAFRAVLAGVMRAVPNADGGAVQTLDGRELVYRAAVGTLAPHVGLRLPLVGSLSGTALRTGEPILCPDVEADGRAAPGLPAALGMRSALYVPVRRGVETVGILKLQSARVEALTAHDLDTAVLIASNVASALAEAGEAEARRAVRRGERRYRTVFESAVDYAIVVLDLDGRVVDWNEGATRILGWTLDEVRDRPADVFFTPEDRVAGIPAQEMRAALTEGRGIDERWHLRKDGSRFWANGEMMPLRDEDDGGPIGFVKILRDRTENREAFERLRDSERRLGVERAMLDAILRQAPVGISIAFADGTAMLNEHAVGMLGHGVGEGGDARYQGYGAVHPEGRPYAVADYPTIRALRTGEIVRGERMLYRRGSDNDVRRWDVSSAPIPGPDGATAAAVTVLVDVEDTQRATDALRLSETRLATVMDTVPVGILLAEAPSGRIIMGNRRLVEVLGHETLYSPGREAYGEYAAFHADGRRVEAHEYPLARICAGECDRTLLEVQYAPPEGDRRWIAISGEAIKDPDGTTVGAVVAMSDIETRKRSEADQDILNRELSHRLKNTLSLVQAIAAQTLRNAPSIDAAREALAARLIALGRAHDILLAGHGDTADIAGVVTGALELHADAADRFRVSGPSMLVGPSAALSLALMLHELATNATKYGALSNATGHVEVSWRVEPADGGERFTLIWRERGGPPVTPPTRRGFGSRLIERGLAGAGGGDVALDYAPEGLTCTLAAPLSGFQAGP